MDTGLYSGIAAMRAAEKRLDTIASNLANLDTPGYKRLGTTAHAFDIGSHARANPSTAVATRERAVATSERVDFSQGVIERTGNALDLALEGEGFFVVETADGEAYTRDGAFHLDERGGLLSRDGDPVAWEGARGHFVPVGTAITVDGSGAVRQGATEIGRLKLADFGDAQRLTRDARGLWHAPRGLEPRPAAATVHQGARERSNAESIDELIAMIRVQRGFESAATLLRSIDQSYRRLNQPR